MQMACAVLDLQVPGALMTILSPLLSLSLSPQYVTWRTVDTSLALTSVTNHNINISFT